MNICHYTNMRSESVWLLTIFSCDRCSKISTSLFSTFALISYSGAMEHIGDSLAGVSLNLSLIKVANDRRPNHTLPAGTVHKVQSLTFLLIVFTAYSLPVAICLYFLTTAVAPLCNVTSDNIPWQR